MMEYLRLNNSDLTVSRFCMGGCPMGGFDWGETNQKDFIEAIQTALAEGVTFFDTADTYGLGQSERTLAKGLGNHRKDVVIQTKFGVRVGNGKTIIDNSPAWIQEALDRSLKRLNTDYIDLYVVHYWDQKTPPEEIVAELERQKAAGKIHTDIERGFIRAEIVAFEDLKACGSMAAVKEKGLFRLEGKEYVMQDGDVTMFRFNI